MPKEHSIVDGAKVKYKGVFDLELLYKKLREWFLNKGYSDTCEGGEEKYSEKIKPNGKQMEIIWKTGKEVEGGYFKLNISLVFFINGLNEVEVDKDGKKIKLNNGEIEISFNALLIENANNSWDEHSLMYKIYHKLKLQNNLEEAKIDLYKDTLKIIDEAKSFLNLYKF